MSAAIAKKDETTTTTLTEMKRKWTGSFQSTTYGWMMVYGSVETWLFDDQEATYETPVTLTYKGIYMCMTTRPGTIKVSPANLIIEWPGQTVTFTITKRTGTKITGTYNSTGRADTGTFELTLA